MHKIFGSRIVFMYIFALTHHLPTISATASDLLSFTISSSPLLSLPLLSSLSFATSASTGNIQADIATTSSSDADLFAIENDVAAKEISIAASSSSSSSSLLSASTGIYAQPVVTSSLSTVQPFEHQKDLAALRRQTRSLFYSYPYGNLYNGYGGISGAFYNPYSSYSYEFSPTSFFGFWGVHNPYNGYLSVILG